MTPEDLAARHPSLFHLAEAAGLSAIQRYGLLPSQDLVALFEVEDRMAQRLLAARRPERVELRHPVHGIAVLNDNRPISDKMLVNCLDDDLRPSDWMRMLNSRVFFWPTRKKLAGLANALLNQGRRKVVLEIDTLSLARAHADRMDLSPFNTGSATRRPARRGLGTYTPLGALRYADWQKKRGGRDTIVEVTVRGPIPDLTTHLRSVEPVGSGR
jgi:hypothetical protein